LQHVAALLKGAMVAFPAGHFYSPLVDINELKNRKAGIWPARLPDIPGIDFRPDEQFAYLDQIKAFAADFDYPQKETDRAADYSFHELNSQFGGLDARMLYCFLRLFRPSHLIEIGSGFSSLLIADVNRDNFNNSIEFSCIEPFPRDFLVHGVPGISRLIQKNVQDIDLRTFQALGPNDILFIDSSHVSKTGSDVNYLFLHVLPRLKKGVIIHIHDIFLPRDYPEDWVLGEGRSWNEQYLLQGMLMFSHGFEVLFSCAYAHYQFPEKVVQTFGGGFSGASFWIRKTI